MQVVVDDDMIVLRIVVVGHHLAFLLLSPVEWMLSSVLMSKFTNIRDNIIVKFHRTHRQ
jgi:hypothetical protein